MLVIRRLLACKRAAAAYVVALALPALVGAVSVGVEGALVQVQKAGLQNAADAAAAAGRQQFDSFQYSTKTGTIPMASQGNAVAYAQQFADANLAGFPANAAAGADVAQGWWDIKTKTLGDPVEGQVGGHYFSNAVQVVTHATYHYVLGKLIGLDSTMLSSTPALGYKCSNLDYPLTLIPDDPNPPELPAFWASFATKDYPSTKTSYFYQDGTSQHPVFKFWAPGDDQDTSFVIHYPDGSDMLQVDTYCRGTYLVAPGDYDWTRQTDDLTVSIHYGDTNNSFSLDPHPEKHPFAFDSTTYFNTNKVAIPDVLMPQAKVKITTYPSSNGNHNWASIGNPTPDRRTILVQ